MAPTKRNSSLPSRSKSADAALDRSHRAFKSASARATGPNDPIFNKVGKIQARASKAVDKYVEARDKLSASSSAASKVRGGLREAFRRGVGKAMSPAVLAEEFAGRAARSGMEKRDEVMDRKRRTKKPVTRA